VVVAAAVVGGLVVTGAVVTGARVVDTTVVVVAGGVVVVVDGVVVTAVDVTVSIGAAGATVLVAPVRTFVGLSPPPATAPTTPIRTKPPRTKPAIESPRCSCQMRLKSEPRVGLRGRRTNCGPGSAAVGGTVICCVIAGSGSGSGGRATSSVGCSAGGR
jgi:hypothetical protein